ncbi:GNAT family N-acetyltransferase [Streptomyces mirabilis]|uniref:GNAT family N-acetyltransferase n=1 Tax=Streptomyces mirabilis TaxID=68239 RepID=UPI0036853376
MDSRVVAQVTANFRRYLMGWSEAERKDELLDYFCSGLAVPQFNGVVRVRSLGQIDHAVATARTRLAGVPWWWWVGPDSPMNTSTLLGDRGAEILAVLPVMARPLGFDDLAPLEGAPIGLGIETVEESAMLREVTRTYSASMGLLPGLEADLARIEVQRVDNADIVRLAAILAGEVVGTATVITAEEVAGIFLVHVAAPYRQRGIGRALTATALRVGYERGMRLAALGASAAGEPLYRQFGFEKIFEYHIFNLSTMSA